MECLYCGEVDLFSGRPMVLTFDLADLTLRAGLDDLQPAANLTPSHPRGF